MHWPDPPEEWRDCFDCGGEGMIPFRITVYEPGCGFPHDDTDERTCETCGGRGGSIEECRAEQLPPDIVEELRCR